MRYFRKTKQKNYCPIVNIDKTYSLFSQSDTINQNNSKSLPLINLNDLSAFKILGKGKGPDIPVLIKAKFFSKKASKKILKSGGCCITIP